MKDYYAILEVPPTASQEAIREQYLLLIQAWHPDKFAKPAQKAKAEEKCKEINIAYGVLGDSRKRAKYDREQRGQPSGSAAEKRRSAEAPPSREQSEAVQRPQREARRPAEQPQEGPSRPKYETPPWEEEEWIRIYFEQARWRQSGSAPATWKDRARIPIRVLIVNDAAGTRAELRRLLSSEVDIQVVGEAPNGLAAIGQFEALMPDVTITGINLPNLDGFAVTEAIRRKHPTAKVIILSAQSSAGYIRRAAMAGACDYLTDPSAVGELRSAIRLAAGQTSSTSGKAAPK